MKTHILRLHIEQPGTRYTAPDGNITSSEKGHTWFEIVSPTGASVQGGFAPSDPKSSPTSAPGKIYDNDGNAYHGRPAFTASYQISKRQADVLTQYISHPEQYGFNKENYHAITNSCVDFVWKALQAIGMNQPGRQGHFLPMDNQGDFLSLRNPATPWDATSSEHLNSLLDSDWYSGGLPHDAGGRSFRETNIPGGTVTVGPLGGPSAIDDAPAFFDFSRAIDTWNAKSASGIAGGFMAGRAGPYDPFPMFNATGMQMGDRLPYACGRNYVPRTWWPD